MASWAKNQIAKQLAKFAKNIDPAQISLKFLKGEGELINLELNEELLSQLLEFPPWLHLRKATCNRISAKMKWTSLKTDPIRLYLDCVEVEIVASEEAREQTTVPHNVQKTHSGSNVSKSSLKPTKYGFVEKVVDGMFVSINTVMATFKSVGFKASFSMSRIIVQSTRPDWHSTDNLRYTRIKDDQRGQVLNFKEIKWGTLRIDADASLSETSHATATPLRLITNNSAVRITIKKKLADCSLVSSRLQVVLDDILWVLTQSQLLKLSTFVQYILKLRMKYLPLTPHTVDLEKHEGPKHASSVEQQFQGKGQGSDLNPLFTKFDVTETSYHVVNRRLDLHLCDDQTLDGELAQRGKSSDKGGKSTDPGGAIQLSFLNLKIDHCPYHIAGVKRNFIRPEDETSFTRRQWAHQLLDHFMKMEAKQRSEQSPRSSINPGHSRKSQAQKARPLMYENFFLVSCQFFDIMQVTTSSVRHPKQFISSDKESLYLPEDMDAFFIDYTAYYHTGQAHLTVPAPNLFMKVNPIKLTFHPLTCVWLSRFTQTVADGLEWTKEFFTREFSPADHLHIRVEALLPKVVLPVDVPEDTIYYNRRPKALQIQIAQAVVTNSRIGSACSQSDLLMDLQYQLTSKLYTDLFTFPSKEEDIGTLPNQTWTNDYSLNHRQFQNHFERLKKAKRCNSSIISSPDTPRQIWCFWADQMWIEFLGISESNGRPITFVDAVPLRLWACVPLSFVGVEQAPPIYKEGSETANHTQSKALNQGKTAKGEISSPVSLVADHKMDQISNRSSQQRSYDSEDIQIRTTIPNGATRFRDSNIVESSPKLMKKVSSPVLPRTMESTAFDESNELETTLVDLSRTLTPDNTTCNGTTTAQCTEQHVNDPAENDRTECLLPTLNDAILKDMRPVEGSPKLMKKRQRHGLSPATGTGSENLNNVAFGHGASNASSPVSLSNSLSHNSLDRGINLNGSVKNINDQCISIDGRKRLRVNEIVHESLRHTRSETSLLPKTSPTTSNFDDTQSLHGFNVSTSTYYDGASEPLINGPPPPYSARAQKEIGERMLNETAVDNKPSQARRLSSSSLPPSYDVAYETTFQSSLSAFDVHNEDLDPAVLNYFYSAQDTRQGAVNALCSPKLPLIGLIAHIPRKTTIQLDHFQLLFLLRLGDMFQEFSETLASYDSNTSTTGTLRKNSLAEGNSPGMTFNLSVTELEIDIILPPCEEVDPKLTETLLERMMKLDKYLPDQKNDIPSFRSFINNDAAASFQAASDTVDKKYGIPASAPKSEVSEVAGSSALHFTTPGNKASETIGGKDVDDSSGFSSSDSSPRTSGKSIVDIPKDASYEDRNNEFVQQTGTADTGDSTDSSSFLSSDVSKYQEKSSINFEETSIHVNGDSLCEPAPYSETSNFDQVTTPSEDGDSASCDHITRKEPVAKLFHISPRSSTSSPEIAVDVAAECSDGWQTKPTMSDKTTFEKKPLARLDSTDQECLHRTHEVEAEGVSPVHMGSSKTASDCANINTDKYVSVVQIRAKNTRVALNSEDENSVTKITVEGVLLEEKGNVMYNRTLNHRLVFPEELNEFLCSKRKDFCESDSENMVAIRIEKGPNAEHHSPRSGELGFAHIRINSLEGTLRLTTTDSLAEFAEDEIIAYTPPFFIELEDLKLMLVDDKPRLLESAPIPVPMQICIEQLIVKRSCEGIIQISPPYQRQHVRPRNVSLVYERNAREPLTRNAMISSSQDSISDSINSRLDELENENERLVEELKVSNSRMCSLEDERDSLLKVVEKLEQELMWSNRENEELQKRVNIYRDRTRRQPLTPDRNKIILKPNSSSTKFV